jgi:hypothetical protein
MEQVVESIDRVVFIVRRPLISLRLVLNADVNRKDAFGCSVLKVAAMAKKNSNEITAFLQVSL